MEQEVSPTVCIPSQLAQRDRHLQQQLNRLHRCELQQATQKNRSLESKFRIKLAWVHCKHWFKQFLLS